MSIKKLIYEYIEGYLKDEKFYTQICKVISVNETDRTCLIEPVNGDAQRTGRIQASVELSNGIYIKPTVSSYVQLAYINKKTGIITKYSSIDSFEIKISDKQLNIDSTEISFNGGSNGGMVVPLSLLSRLNLIEQDINDLKQVFTTWVIAPTDGGLALKTAAATWYGSSLTETQITDIENQDIKQ